MLLISPTGSGYVNYCATAAASYLTRGDLAMVTMQYSKRPSPLSFSRSRTRASRTGCSGWKSARGYATGADRGTPRIVLFGESLGAHTSQDVLLHWGTLGPQALGIDRALWIGTPYGSGWMRQVTGPPRPDVDPELVARSTTSRRSKRVSPGTPRRRQIRVGQPRQRWRHEVRRGSARVQAAWPGSPDEPSQRCEICRAQVRGEIPARMRWRPMTTFLQRMIDMKNAQKMAGYRPWAHDYRPDLARFVAEVYDLPATEDQLVRIERALQEREERREELFSHEALAAMRRSSPG